MEEAAAQNWPYVLIAALAALLLLYGLFEVHYFLRMCVCVLLARCWKRRCHILATTTVTGLCLSNDIDTLLCHMNNARYLRELDFARVDFYERTQLYRTIRSKGGTVYQGAATIRYRRFIRPFHRYKIVSRIVYWDANSLFMEHRFMRPSDDFVHAIAICRQRLCDCSADEVMAELLSRPTTTITPKYLSTASTAATMLTNTTKTTNMAAAAAGLGATSTTNLQASQNSILSDAPTMLTAATSTTSAATSPHHMERGAAAGENGQVQGVATTTTTMTLWSRPEVPPELLKWIEYNDLSSKNLRNGC